MGDYDNDRLAHIRYDKINKKATNKDQIELATP